MTQSEFSDNDEFDLLVRYMVHDLRNSLQAIHLTLTVFQRAAGTQMNPLVQEYFERINRVKREMDLVLAAVTDYRQMRNRDLNIENVNLKGLIEGLREKEVVTDRQSVIVKGNLPTIESDPSLLEYILKNLIRNGLKFNNREKNIVVVSAQVDDSEGLVSFIVEDNGIGISPGNMKELFQPFKRMVQNYGDGPGAGLFISKVAARRLGATIDVESNLGEGSRFILRHPLRQ